MQKQSFMRADEVAQELGISKSHAYKVIHGLTDLQNDKRSLRTGLVHERGIITSAYMTTKLAGEATFFLPFNMGNGEGVTAGAGNPTFEDKYSVS